MKAKKVFEIINNTNNISNIVNNELIINTNYIKTLFSFVGEGINDIELESFEKINSQEYGVYQNEIIITFTDNAYNYISLNEWNKVDEICKDLVNNGITDYIINTTKNTLTLIFDDKYEMIEL